MNYLIAAIDPGDRYCGLAVFELCPTGHPELPYLDSSKRHRVCLRAAETVSPDQLFVWLEVNAHRLYAVVIERFRLYPWMAREQGFSEFPTPQHIGIIKYIASKAGVLIVMQETSCKREGRNQALKIGFRMPKRRVGKGRHSYYGPDFDLPGKDHHRDAAAHGVRFATMDKSSPLLTRRQATG